MKKTITLMQNAVDGINGILWTVVYRINNLEDWSVEYIYTEANKGKR